MASLDLLVDIDLDVAGPSVQVPSFGIPLVVGHFTAPAWTERVRSYSTLAEVAADGFAVTSPVYRACSAVFAQAPAPESVMVGRRALASANAVRITPTAANSRAYTLDLLGVDGVAYAPTFTTDATATVAEITAGLTSAINALAAGAAVTATDGTTYVDVLADVAGTYFAVASAATSLALLSFDQNHADPGIATDLTAIAAENNEWYGFTIADDQGGATITAAAAWALSNGKMFFAGSQDSDLYGSGSADVASVLNTASSEYTSVIYHARAGLEAIGAAALGVLFSHDPGAVTLHGKRFLGITADTLSGTQLGYLLAKRAGTYTTYGTLPLYREGRMAGGQWADVIRDLDWVQTTMQADLVTALVASPKLPYTDVGTEVLKGAVRGRLALAEAAGVFASGWTVSSPKVAAISAVDKGNRTYGPITWTATLAGAIHSVTVRGTVTY